MPHDNRTSLRPDRRSSDAISRPGADNTCAHERAEGASSGFGAPRRHGGVPADHQRALPRHRQEGRPAHGLPGGEPRAPALELSRSARRFLQVETRRAVSRFKAHLPCRQPRRRPWHLPYGFARTSKVRSCVDSEPASLPLRQALRDRRRHEERSGQGRRALPQGVRLQRSGDGPARHMLPATVAASLAIPAEAMRLFEKASSLGDEFAAKALEQMPVATPEPWRRRARRGSQSPFLRSSSSCCVHVQPARSASCHARARGAGSLVWS